MTTGDFVFDGDGSFPRDDHFKHIFNDDKNNSSITIGYLSKRSPRFSSMKEILAIIDGFLIDTDKLHLHPYVGQAREKDSLFKIYHIFKKLLLERSQPERACEFLDRHLRGNMIIKENEVVYAYRESTGFKPLVKGRDSRNSLFMVASEIH